MLSLISDFKTLDANGNLLNPNADGKPLGFRPCSTRARLADANHPIRNARPQSGAKAAPWPCAANWRRGHPPEPALDARLDSQPAGCAARRAVLLPRAAPVLPPARLQRHRHGAGRHAQLISPASRKPYVLALAFKYSFLEGDPAASLRGSSVFRWRPTNPSSEKTACKETERLQRDTWKGAPNQAPAPH